MEYGDLNIGNYVSVKEGLLDILSECSHDSPARLKVKGVSEEYVTVHVKNKNINLRYDQILGIELTDSVMIDLGFSYGRDKCILEKDYISLYFMQKKWMVYFGSTLVKTSLNLVVKYVHELQNLYKELERKKLVFV